MKISSSLVILVKQLKNRYNDPNIHKRFVIGVDRSKMRLSDVEDADKDLVNDVSAPGGIPDKPIFDQTPSGKKLNVEGFQI